MTKKQIGLFIALLPILLSAQKEIFFGDNIPKALPVKMVRGIETRVSIPTKNFDYSRLSTISAVNTAFYLGRFSETLIDEDWNIHNSIGFQFANYQHPSWQSKLLNDPSSRYYDPSPSSAFALELLASAEPRYYMGSNEEYGQLNSGLYLSFPCLLQTILFHTPLPTLHQGWFPSILYYNLAVSPTLGMRKLISKQLFCELSTGVLVSLRSRSDPIYSSWLEPMFQLKLAKILSH